MFTSRTLLLFRSRAGKKNAADNIGSRPLSGQEKLIATLALSLFVFFSLSLPGFNSLGNFLTLAKSMSVLGILALGMMLVIIGRGIDLAQIVIGILAMALAITLMNQGFPLVVAIGAAAVSALLLGMCNGYLVHALAVPPLFTTFASALLFTGLARITFMPSMILHLPANKGGIHLLAQSWLGVPVPVWCLLLSAFAVYAFLRFTTAGYLIYAHGSNPHAARLTGMSLLRWTLLEYTLCALLGFMAAMVMTASTSMVDMKITHGSLIFEVIVVVIAGGVSLQGGRGTVFGVMAATLLMGILFNAMTILNLDYQLQNIIKGGLLLLAVSLDGLLNQRRESDMGGL
jgi:ribose transport system permease protein